MTRLCTLLAGLLVLSTAAAQDLGDDLFDGASELGGSPTETADKPSPKPGGFNDFGSGFGFGNDSFGSFGKSGFGSNEPQVTVALTPEAAGPGEVVTLSIRLQMPAGSHTYALNRSGDAPAFTQIAVKFPATLSAIDTDFTPDREPEVKSSAAFGTVRQFEDEVTWSRRFRVVGEGVGTAELTGLLDYQVCDTNCVPYEEPFKVSLELTDEAVDRSMAYRYTPRRGEGDAATSDPVAFQAEVFPANPTPGTEVIVALTLELDAGWKTYGLDTADSQNALPTEIATTRVDGLQPLDERWQAIRPPVDVKQAGGGSALEHTGRVTWQRRFLVEGETPALAGTVTYQLCSDNGECLPPNAAAFALGDAYEATTIASVPGQFFAEPSFFDVGDKVAAADIKTAGGSWSLPAKFGLALLGGLILNVMPCVLPVLAIKVMGFVQQAGESRSRIFLLNVSFSLGILAVFAVFGALAVTSQIGLGEQFQTQWFRVAMACLVFVSALSLLGVFEFPVPGFLGAGGAEHKEGLSGAFLTGGMATLLATPCVGPFIGPALAATVDQPAAATFGLWLTAGVGMAMPFLIAAVFPRVVEFLPRPGAWMIWFKQASGLVMMATVVYLVAYTGIPAEQVGPLLAFLVGLAAACWVWGTFKPHAAVAQRVPVYAASAVTAAAAGWVAVWLATPSDYELPWQPFSDAALAELLDDGETVLVDFTAVWCQNCHLNEEVALNTEETYRLVQEHGIRTLLGDYTDQDPEIKQWLNRFETIGVPLTLVIPDGDIDRAIAFKSLFTQSELTAALKQAVSDDTASPKVAMAE